MTDVASMTHRHGCPLPGLRASVVGDLRVIRCNGCNACVRSCPVKVITLDHEVRYGELSGGTQDVYRKAGGSKGAVSRT